MKHPPHFSPKIPKRTEESEHFRQKHSWLKRIRNFFPFLTATVPALFACACRETPIPKPRAYMRIEVPKKSYRDFDTLAYPFTFRIPAYARFKPVPSQAEYPNTRWADIEFPGLDARIYLSHVYKPDLDSCLTSTLFFIQRHMSKSTGVDEWEINKAGERKYGYLYHIKGNDVASTYQFYLTDSNLHFVRGSLYINCIPNNDSLAPVINFLKTDIDTLLESWQWKR